MNLYLINGERFAVALTMMDVLQSVPGATEVRHVSDAVSVVHGDMLADYCIKLGVNIAELRGRSRSQSLVLHRSALARLMRDAGLSLNEIADKLHRDCHQSIMHYLRTTDERVNQLVEQYRAKV